MKFALLIVGRSSSLDGIDIMFGIVLLEGGVEVEKDEIGEGHGRKKLGVMYICAQLLFSSTAKCVPLLFECDGVLGLRSIRAVVDGEVGGPRILHRAILSPPYLERFARGH